MMSKLLKVLVTVGLIGLLIACNENTGGNISATPVDVSGVWNVSEQIDNMQCGGAGDSDSYTVTVTQTGSSITVVSSDGTFSGSVSGSTLSWRGEYYSRDQGVWITITAMSLTIDGDHIFGNANWEVRDMQGGPVTCTGSTAVDGSRTAGTPPAPNDPAPGIPVPDAPAGLNATTLSASSIQLAWTDNSDNEQSFLIERADGSPNGFSQIATVTTNVVSYDDTNLSPSTTYYYQVSARNSSGDSAWSNIAQATTSAPSVVPPPAPGALSATALTSGSIQLDWTDLADNEDQYRIERGLSAGNYAEVALIAPDSTTYTDTTGIQGSTLYYYRVVAFNTAGANGATTSVQTPAETANFILTVNKAGTGSGSVTATGIDCGSDCTHTAPDGTTITLTASALSGSAFDGWSGCTSSSGTSCTVDLTSDTTVVASFNTVFSQSISLSLPSTSTTGNYTLSWTVTGLGSTSWVIQEDSDTSFSSPSQYYLNNAVTYAYSFSNKTDGNYCYRVKSSFSWSDAKCITVAMPTSATLRIVNNTRYDMIDLELNNAQQISWPYGIAPGQSADFVFNTSGGVSVSYGVGFYDYLGYRDIWFTGQTNVTLTSGQTYTLTVNNPTLGDILSGFSNSRNWDGMYYCYSCSYLVHGARFNFTNNGNWSLYDDGVFVGSGAATLVSWPTYGSIITFKLCPTCENIQLPYPFGVFNYSNGPADWPVIEYVGQ